MLSEDIWRRDPGQGQGQLIECQGRFIQTGSVSTLIMLQTSPRFNPLHFTPNYKFFNLSKLKAFADNKINVTKKLKFVTERVENIVGKGETAGYQHFLLFPQCFQKDSFSRLLKVGIVWYSVKRLRIKPKFAPIGKNPKH